MIGIKYAHNYYNFDIFQEFEKLASRKLRISAKEAMKIAEKLYTQGIISYPRTETNIFPEGLDLRPLVNEQTASNQWGGACYLFFLCLSSHFQQQF